MSEVVYRSEVRIERVKGPVRKAYLPAESEPAIFGVHGAVAEHYAVAEHIRSRPTLRNQEDCLASQRGSRGATTLDYIVATAAG
jgi:hypothetical protein